MSVVSAMAGASKVDTASLEAVHTEQMQNAMQSVCIMPCM